MRPTEEAQNNFRLAEAHANFGADAGAGKDMTGALLDVSMAVMQLAKGLNAMAIGLRATYMLLEEVNSKLLQTGAAGPYRP